MNKFFLNIILIFGFFNFFSCKNDSNKKIEKSEFTEPLIRVNKTLVEKDSDLILKYAKRRNLELSVSSTGLYYEIYSSSNEITDSVQKGSRISIAYKLSLLDGKVCYSSDSTGLKEFIVGNGEVENGLDQGVRLLKRKDKAKLILPPHLAFGLLGDGLKIPARSIVIYEIEVVKVNN